MGVGDTKKASQGTLLGVGDTKKASQGTLLGVGDTKKASQRTLLGVGDTKKASQRTLRLTLHSLAPAAYRKEGVGLWVFGDTKKASQGTPRLTFHSLTPAADREEDEGLGVRQHGRHAWRSVLTAAEEQLGVLAVLPVRHCAVRLGACRISAGVLVVELDPPLVEVCVRGKEVKDKLIVCVTGK